MFNEGKRPSFFSLKDISGKSYFNWRNFFSSENPPYSRIRSGSEAFFQFFFQNLVSVMRGWGFRPMRDVGIALNCPEGWNSFLGSLWEVGVFNPMILKEQASYPRGSTNTSYSGSRLEVIPKMEWDSHSKMIKEKKGVKTSIWPRWPSHELDSNQYQATFL